MPPVRKSANNGPNSTLSSNSNPPQEAAAETAEPSQSDIVPIYTGRHLWSAVRPTPPATLSPPLVAYDELPFPKSDRAKLPPCTVRWQFTGRFSLNREEDIARGSFRVQVRRFLTAKGAASVDCNVNFPRNIGRGRFVEITVAPESLATLAEVQLVFNGSPLQRLFVGPALPKTAMVVEVLGIPSANARSETARYIALSLHPFIRVHDVWVAQISYANDPTPPEDTNRMQVLVSSVAGTDGGIDPSKVHNIPGYIRIGGVECEVSYIGRLPWCTTCCSVAASFHKFENCPRRRCFRCSEQGHTASQCTAEVASPFADDAMAEQQMVEERRGTNALNYGSA